MTVETAPVDMRLLEKWLGGEPFVAQLHYQDELGSTNDEMKKLAADGAPAGTVLVAGCQTEGRGRLGRRWHSPPYSGLYLSLLLRPAAPVAEWTRWTLGAAVAGAEAARACRGRPVTIKWPNDLILDHRKLGGLLTETRASGQNGGELVIGLGMNVAGSSRAFPGSLSDTAISLEESGGETGRGRERLAAAFLREMGRIDRELERGEWSRVERRWLDLAPEAVGCRVRVAASGRPLSYHGTTCGLDPTGALIVVRDEDGQRIAVRDVCSVSPLEKE